MRSQPVVASSVVVLVVVLLAIAFHNHSVGKASEVDNEPSYDYLPAKMTFQLMPRNPTQRTVSASVMVRRNSRARF